MAQLPDLLTPDVLAASNNRDKNFARAKMERRMAQIEESVARYLQQLDTADRQEPSEALKTKTSRLKEKIEKLKEQMRRLNVLKVEMLAAPDQQISLTDPDARSMATSGRGSGVVGYNVQVAVDTTHHLIVTHGIPIQNGKAAKLGKITAPGHRARVTRRQCFRQGVFTQPRPSRDMRPILSRAIVCAIQSSSGEFLSKKGPPQCVTSVTSRRWVDVNLFAVSTPETI